MTGVSLLFPWPESFKSSSSKPLFCSQAIPAAHRGFLSRAKAIPIEGLFAHACQHGKRLVLTGAYMPCCPPQSVLTKLL